jgi:NAD(P)-dependent dehydrogenase (short-subunit alcohol dehydrogenase family)
MAQTVLITGTSTGFGNLTARTLARAGHTVVAGMRGTTGKNAAAAQELQALPGVEVVEMDVTSDESVGAAVQQTLSRHGKLDVLVNNAAVMGFGVTEAYSIGLVKDIFETNFFGVLRVYDAVLPAMRAAKKGLIINLSTGASGFALPYIVPYSASKFALEALTEGIDSELRAFGIENVSIPCGVYPTGMSNKGGFNADKEAIAEHYLDFPARMQAMGTALFGKMAEFAMDSQTIANGIQAVLDLAPGTRPLRYPLDAIAQGTDQAFIEARAASKADWATRYGFDL